MESRRDGEVSKGTEAQAEGKVEKGVHEGQREEHGGKGQREGGGYGRERACGMNRSRAGVFSTQGRSAPGIGVGKSFDVSHIADLV